MTRWMVFALGLVCAALALIVYFVVDTVGRERVALSARFGEDRQRQLAQAAEALADDFRDVAEDLRFAGQLVQAADSASDRERELGALLAVVRHYRAIEIYDAGGARVLSVRDPLDADPGRLDVFIDDLRGTARAALARAPGAIATSAALRADPSGWYRVFATALPNGRGALAVLIDTAPMAARLRLLASDKTTRLALFGAHGAPLPATDAALLERLRAAAPGGAHAVVAKLKAAMAPGRPALLRLSEQDARALGAGAEELSAALHPVALPGGDYWSVVTLSDLSVLRAHDRALFVRAMTGAAAAGFCLMIFGVFAVVAARRDAAMRERLRHADTLAHLHEKTEKVLDNIPAGVMTLSQAGAVSAMNRALAVRLGAAAVGGDLRRALPKADAKDLSRLAMLVDEALASGRVQSALAERMQLFGLAGRYSLHAVPLDQRFPDARALVVIDDLSALGDLEDQLLAAEKHATVGVLAAGIAHEIGTPLGIARARAELMLAKLGREHPLSDSARVVMEQVDRVARTIRQLLDFSRIKPPSVQPVSLAATAASVVELLRIEMQRRGVALAMEVPDELPAIAADPDQLQQVLVNLVMNSGDACERGGSVTIRAAREDAPGRAVVCIEVVDSGVGIPAELRHRVFDPFFTTKKRGQGTGLGLTLAAQVVRNHAGQIELDSAPSRGTTVSIRWPISVPLETEHVARP